MYFFCNKTQFVACKAASHKLVERSRLLANFVPQLGGSLPRFLRSVAAIRINKLCAKLFESRLIRIRPTRRNATRVRAGANSRRR